MTRKAAGKIGIDAGMTALLLLLMAFEMVGRQAHEWLGMAMFALFLSHHALNHTWLKNIRNGKYTPFRAVQLTLVILIFICMLSSMTSGILLSEHIFRAVHIRGVSHTARMVHILAAYWGFVLMSLHLGIHWSMILGMSSRMLGRKPRSKNRGLKIWGAAVAGYGIYAFSHRQFGTYLFLQMDFVLYDFDEPLAQFLIDYLAIMALFIWIGYYGASFIKKK